jgi:hypothetical protein
MLAPDGQSAILTTTAQPENTSYTLTMQAANGVSDLAGNVLPDSMAQFNSWIRTNCPGLLFEAYNGTAGPTTAGLIAGNAVAILTAHQLSKQPQREHEHHHL